jgi:hypothetical protein
MSIEIAFTRSNLIMSRVIRGVTGEDVSHCAIIVDNLWVIHSNFKGVNAEYIGDFTEVNTIVDRIPYNGNRERILDMLEDYHSSSYDFWAMIYSGLLLILHRCVPRFIPKQNLWQTSGMFICTEFLSKVIFNQEDSLITPGQLREKLRAK